MAKREDFSQRSDVGEREALPSREAWVPGAGEAPAASIQVAKPSDAPVIRLAQADQNQPQSPEQFDVTTAPVSAVFTSNEFGQEITLPEGTDITRVLVLNGNLYFIQPDGSVVIVVNGAVNYPTLIITEGVIIPAENLKVALENLVEGQVAAGPEAGPGGPEGTGSPDYSVDQGGIGDGVPIIDLLPLTVLNFPLFNEEDREFLLGEEFLFGEAVGSAGTFPVIGTPDRGAVEEDDLPGSIQGPTIRAVGPNSFFFCDAEGNDLYPDMSMSFGGALSFTGNLDVTGATTVEFSGLGATAVPYILSDDTPVTSGGKTVLIQRVDLFGNPDNTQLVGFVDNDGDGEYQPPSSPGDPNADQVIFNVYITPDGSGGFQYTIDVYCSLDHGIQVHNGIDGDTIPNLLPGENDEELLPLDFNFTATNGGGSTTGSFIVDWQDDNPAIGDGEFLPERPEFSRVDEDDLVDGNDDDEPGDDDTLTNTSIDTDADASTVSGSLGIYWGADHHNDNDGIIPGDRMVVLTGLTVRDQAFNILYDGDTNDNLMALVPSTPGGMAVEQAKVTIAITTDANQQSVLTGSATASDGTPYTVFRVTTSDAGFGSYTFALDPDQAGVSLYHPYTDSDLNNDGEDSSGNPQTSYEDNLTFIFGFNAKDSDGDTVAGEFEVSADDDSPVIVSRAMVMGVVEEEHLDSDQNPMHLSVGNEDDFSGDGSDPDNDLDLDTIAPDDFSLTTNSFSGTGATSLANLVDFGADGPNFMLKDATGFSDPTLKDVNGNTVTSYGQDVIFTGYDTSTPGQTTLTAKANAAVAGTVAVTGDTTLAELGVTASLTLDITTDGPGGVLSDIIASVGPGLTISGLISVINFGLENNITAELSPLGQLMIYGDDPSSTFTLSGEIWAVLGIPTGTYSERTVFDLTVEQDGDWTANIYDQFDHHLVQNADDIEDILELELSGLVLAADGDDDSVMLDDDTFTLKVIDDIPVRISPEQATLENDGTSGAPSSFTGALDFFHNIGADEAGKVVFVDQNNADDFLRDTGGNFVTVGGDNIVLTGFGTTVLEGYVDTSGDGVIDSGEPLALRITLNPDAVTQASDTYTVELFAEFDNTSGATSSNVVDSLSNSARTYKGADNVLGDIDVLFSANDETGARADVNKSNGGAVGAGSQGTGPDDILRMDFTRGLVVNEASASGETFFYTEHALINNVSFAINQITPTNNDVNMIIRLYDADDEAGTISETDTSWHAPADAGDTIVDISQIIINDGVATPGVTVVIDASGNFATITGLSVGDKIEVVGVSDYDRIEVQNADDSSVPSNNTKFDIENIRFETAGTASPIIFDVDLEVFDQDGDSVSAQLPVEVSPQNTPPVLDLDLDDSGTISTGVYVDTFTIGGGPVPIADDDTTIVDATDTNIESAMFTLTNPQAGNTEFLTVDVSAITAINPSIVVSGNNTDMLTFTGSATLTEYEQAIELVQYNNTSTSPTVGMRSIEVVVNDGDANSNTAQVALNVSSAAPTTAPLIVRIEQFNHDGPNDDLGFEDVEIFVGAQQVTPTLGAFNGTNSNPPSVTDFILNANSTRFIELDLGNQPVSGSVTINFTYDPDNNNANEGPVFTLKSGGDSQTIKTVSGNTVAGDHALTFDYSINAGVSVSNVLFNGAADPIVLDLGEAGIHFSTLADPVSFDMDGDGVSEQIAWTTGEDGILVMDTDGSGAIENGTEVLSPYFAGGEFADSVAALASLDENGDGLIDAGDSAFADLQVLVDANHDGVSQQGELASLSDLGISSINLDVEIVDDLIDGQQVFASGHFTLEDGETRDYVGVNLDMDAVETSPIVAKREVEANLSGNQFVIAFIAAAFALESITSITIDISAQAATIDPAQLGVALGDGSTIEGVSAYVSEDGNSLTVILAEGAVSEGDGLTIELSTAGGIEIDPAGAAFSVGFDDGTALEGDFAIASSESGSDNGTAVASVEAEVVIGQTIHGTDGDDVLVGTDGDDVISGGAGDDVINGGLGQNTLTGGEGADTFVLSHLDIADIITDYDFGEGDEIDLSGLLGDSDASAEGANLGNFVRVVAQEGDDASLEVDATGGGREFAQVAKLQGLAVGDTVRVVIDDGEGGASSGGDIVV